MNVKYQSPNTNSAFTNPCARAGIRSEGFDIWILLFDIPRRGLTSCMGLFLFGGTKDGRKDKCEFLSFLPQGSAFVCLCRLGFRDHTKPVFGLFGFLCTDSNFMPKIFLRFRGIRFHVIGPNTGTRADNLTDERIIDEVFRECFGELNNPFPKLGRPFL